MQHKSPHGKSASAKLTLVVISDAERPSRTFKASKIQLVLIVLFGIVVIGVLSVVALIYTPMGRLVLPDYFSTQKEQLRKVELLESKVDAVQKQMTYLSAYNQKLRNILGDSALTTAPQSVSLESGGSSQHVEVQQEQAGKEESEELASAYKNASIEPNFSSSYRNDVGSVLPLIMPVNGYITRGIDYQIQHYGVDISAPKGSPIVAPAPGEVVFVDWTLDGGNTLMIAHPGDFITVYKHCERILVSVGTKVSRGEVIALVGSTGITSTGPHLHFELWQDGKNLNPENYLLTKN